MSRPPGLEITPTVSQALAKIRLPETRIYLGARYGFTPQTYISPAQVELLMGARPTSDHHEPFSNVAHRLANIEGRPALEIRLGDIYEELEQVAETALEELALLRPVAAGKAFVTSAYSRRIADTFDNLTIVDDEAGVPNVLLSATSKKTYLLMLHGQQTKLKNALLTSSEIAFEKNRPGLSRLLRELLIEGPWIVLGHEEAADGNFFQVCWDVCQHLEDQQRPIFVVDSRPPELVAMEWPRKALRHIRMRPLEFLQLLSSEGDSADSPAVSPPPGKPPAADGPRSESGSGIVVAPDDEEGPDEPNPSPPTPPADSTRTLQLHVAAPDNRIYRVGAPRDIRISSLANQFLQQHVLGRGGGAGRRAVAEVERDGHFVRLDAEQTVEEAGLREGDRINVHPDTVAGVVDPRRREAYLNDVQMRLEDLAKVDPRVSLKCNLPRASDRYELTLECGGWGPPRSFGDQPYRTSEQKVLVEYPAEAPDVAPRVVWKSPAFHPNIQPKRGNVCLGVLQENFTPLFGPVELIYLLIDLSEYRNYELRGVLNTEAAIWAQLHPDLIVAHGGWAYQPTIEEWEDDSSPQLHFEEAGTGVGLKRRRKA